jgi:hypothetical protein
VVDTYTIPVLNRLPMANFRFHGICSPQIIWMGMAASARSMNAMYAS